MENQEQFNNLIAEHRIVIERYINYRMPSTYDADDVIQETYLAAVQSFDSLKNKSAFKSWLLSIAKHKCDLWYRKKYKTETVPLDEARETAVREAEYDDTVSSTLKKIPPEYANLLRLIMHGYTQKQIADKLNIPVGTVKSRTHYAKKLFRAACSPEIKSMYERGTVMTNENLHGFPLEMPELTITKLDKPFFEVKTADEWFIIPVIGNQNAEGTYRYPEKNLALVSNCYVPKNAYIHGVQGVKICRDTYNLKHKKLYKNECVWFAQLTDDYIRDLGVIHDDSDGDFPSQLHTFLEEDYNKAVNGDDGIHGRPLLIKENPPKIEGDNLIAEKYYQKYTMGVCEVKIGSRSFETVCYLLPQNEALVTENYVDRTGRLIMLRWYESEESIENDEYYTDEHKAKLKTNPTIKVNGITFHLIEDRISQYAL